MLPQEGSTLAKGCRFFRIGIKAFLNGDDFPHRGVFRFFQDAPGLDMGFPDDVADVRTLPQATSAASSLPPVRHSGISAFPG